MDFRDQGPMLWFYKYFCLKIGEKFRRKFFPKNVGVEWNLPRKKFWKIVFSRNSAVFDFPSKQMYEKSAPGHPASGTHAPTTLCTKARPTPRCRCWWPPRSWPSGSGRKGSADRKKGFRKSGCVCCRPEVRRRRQWRSGAQREPGVNVINVALAAWHSGYRVSLQNRRSRVRIPPGCEVLRVLCTLHCCCQNLICIVIVCIWDLGPML
jgi:hypothetical protein